MQRRQCLCDDRYRACSHIGPDFLGPVGEDDARLRLRVGRQGGAQPARHLSRDLDPGQSRANDQHRVPPGRAWLARQPGEMRTEAHCRLIGVDIKSMLPQPRDWRSDQSAAEGEDHAIVGELG